jgi:gliding motility-associated-like protein
MNKHCFRKIQYCLLLILLSCSSKLSFGQGSYNTTNWRFSNPKPFGITVLDVDFFDNNNVIAVGSDGGLAKSTDGGATWTYGPFTFFNAAGQIQKPTFNDVHYITSTIAYAVGTNGCMVKTTDGGVTWNMVISPLYSNAKNINAVWFLNKDTGYIGGQFNTPDSLPKLYVTRNGGTTWDSIAAPVSNGKSRVGYINNVNLPSQVVNVDAKAKEIYRIEFLNDSIGYVCGSASSLFPAVPGGAANATTCLPTGGNLTGSASNAALLWKISKGVITDYSLSKERLGYTGINTNTVTCTTSYNSAGVSPVGQTYRAMSIINDSAVIMMSFNNNTVVRVNTGKNDSTLNVNVAGVYEKGKYQILNFPFPPTGGPNAGPPIPPVQVLLASNPYQIKKASNGKLFAAANFGYVWTSVDTGRNWKQEWSLPQGKNFSSFATWALDIAPNGKFLSMGQAGVVADSVPSGAWKSNYITVPASSAYSKIDFADCNNGIAAGSSNITVTTDGGATWIDKGRPDFAASFYSINGLAYPTTTKTYFAVSNGVIYGSTDKGTTLDPLFSDFNYQMQDVAAIGKDTVWAVGSSQFSVAAASRTSAVFRSYNGGNTWSTISGFPVGTLFQTLTDIEFPTKTVGYAAGNRDTIYKTTDGGTTWTKLPLPFPGVTPQITYTDLYALDANTVFLCGNGFPRKVVIKTTDGGATWIDITNNIPSFGGGNLNGVLFHDANNGYVVSPGGVMFKTNNGGTSWTIDVAPTANLFTAMAFAPRTVPAAISMINRKLFVSGPNISGAPIMEYGNPANIAVNSTETVVNATCTNPNGGSITINATGAIAPYQYSINGGAFQAGNIFTGLTQGPKTITITDAFCGTLTKTVNVGFTDNLTLTTSNDTAVCAGANAQLIATSAANTYVWTPAAGLSSANISNPVATVFSAVTYTVTASLNGCVRTKVININTKANPIINAGSDKTIVDGDVVTLDGSVSNNNIQSILWSPAATITGGVNALNATAKPSVTTTYTLTVKDNNSCTSTDNMVVTVIPYCVKIMDAFTPNGDGINDKWLVTSGGSCTKQVMVNVYNRNGEQVYSNENYQNDWNGTYKGKALPDATYYYVIRYKLINGNGIQLKGDVTILR